jgi:hypothetical protein
MLILWFEGRFDFQFIVTWLPSTKLSPPFGFVTVIIGAVVVPLLAGTAIGDAFGLHVYPTGQAIVCAATFAGLIKATANENIASGMTNESIAFFIICKLIINKLLII